MMDERRHIADAAGAERIDDLLQEEPSFDPRIAPRRRWRELLAAGASFMIVVAGGYAVGATDGPNAVVSVADAARSNTQKIAPQDDLQFAAAGATVHTALPDTLARPALTFASAPAKALDYTQLDSATTDRIAGMSTEQFEIRSGDTLARVLTHAGVSTEQASAAINALKEVFDPRDLKVGQKLTLQLYTSALRRVATRPDAPVLVRLSLMPDVDRTVAVALDPEGEYQAEETMVELTRELVRVNSSIDSALWIDMNEAGATDRIIANFANLFSYSVDIQRQIQTGDAFEILYEQFRGPDGELVRTGEILYAALETNDVLKQLYRFDAAEGADYFDADGVSIRRFLMKTPINGARLSSGFGMRRHPIQGYNRLHKGTDFAAPRGTPIYAAGDGVIEKQYRSSSYGNYILIRHNGTWQTAYAHMNNFADGMREGRRVAQGEVIGYVGTTGNSTGPHLHYEVLQNGEAVDSMSINVPTGKELEGDELARFAAAREITSTQYAEAPTALDSERTAEASRVAVAANAPAR